MSKEKCTICGVNNTDKAYYVDGIGQLCEPCYSNTILIPTSLIKSIPNDMELGKKIREIYNRKK